MEKPLREYRGQLLPRIGQTSTNLFYPDLFFFFSEVLGKFGGGCKINIALPLKLKVLLKEKFNVSFKYKILIFYSPE